MGSRLQLLTRSGWDQPTWLAAWWVLLQLAVPPRLQVLPVRCTRSGATLGSQGPRTQLLTPR